MLTFTINGTDYSNVVNRHGYSLTYEPRYGGNGGMMLDGSDTVDILTWKAKITCILNFMTASQISALQTDVLTAYVTVTYFDTKTNADRTARFKPSLSGFDYAFTRNMNKLFKDGATLTLTER